MSDNIIHIENLTFSREARLILGDINLVIPRGKIIAIMGPSGCGKTTLLRLMGGQLRPQQGIVNFNGININGLSRKKLYKTREDMGMLFQHGALFTNLTVFENVAFPLREHTSLSENLIRTLVLMKLNMVGLRGTHKMMPSELSGGMSRRVALARALALDPQLIMYDEPFTGQDPISMGVLVRLIKTLNDNLGLTSIIVSHDVPETASIADEVFVLAQGQLVGQGTPEQVMRDTSPRVHQFIHGEADGAVPFHYPAKSLEEDFIA